MKTTYRKKFAAALLVLGAVFSVNAQAEQSRLEQAIGSMVVAQGQQMMTELATQLQQSIKAELANFSIDSSLWASEQPASPNAQAKRKQKTDKSTSEE